MMERFLEGVLVFWDVQVLGMVYVVHFEIGSREARASEELLFESCWLVTGTYDHALADVRELVQGIVFVEPYASIVFFEDVVLLGALAKDDLLVGHFAELAWVSIKFRHGRKDMSVSLLPSC